MADDINKIEAADNLEEPVDTSDPQAVNRARKKASRTRADRLRFVEAAMGTVEGRAWYYDFLNRCHIFNRSFDPDPHIHAFKAGEVNVGLQVLLDIQDAAPDRYMDMIKESRKN